jgi:hypothetical protein
MPLAQDNSSMYLFGPEDAGISLNTESKLQAALRTADACAIVAEQYAAEIRRLQAGNDWEAKAAGAEMAAALIRSRFNVLYVKPAGEI